MKKLVNIILGLIKSETFIFIIGKYFSYLLIFLNSLLIAKIIGPYQFGIWSFVILVLNYLSYTNFGIQYSVNVLLSTEDRSDNDLLVNINSNSILSTLIISLLIIMIGLIVYFYDIQIFSKYEFRKYLLPVLLIASLFNFNQLFMNVFRSFGKFYQILGFLILPYLFILVMLFIGPLNEKIFYMLLGNLAGNIIALIIYLKTYPLKLRISFNKSITRKILSKGIILLLYNASFYFILLSSRTLVSIYFDVKSLGLFSFANTIAQSAILILNVISFVFFPKILNKLRSGDEKDVYPLLKQIRDYYVTSSNFIVVCVLLVYPVLLMFLDGYDDSMSSFLFLILTQLIIVNAFGYSNLIIARGFESKIAFYALITVILNVLISILFIKVFHLNFEYVAFATLISTNYYSYAVVRLGRKILFSSTSIISVLKEVFPIRILVPFILMMLSGFLSYRLLLLSAGCIVFILFNYKYLIESVKVFIRVMNNPNATKF